MLTIELAGPEPPSAVQPGADAGAGAGSGEPAAASAPAGGFEAALPLPERLPPDASRLEWPAEAAGHEPPTDDIGQDRRLPREGTERAHYLRFLAMARRQDGSISAAARQVFGADSPVNERVALLRALWDGGSADAATWFTAALTAPAERSLPAADVPDFAVRFLAIRAPREPAANAILAAYVATAPPDCDPARLARAAAALEENPPVASSDEP